MDKTVSVDTIQINTLDDVTAELPGLTRYITDNHSGKHMLKLNVNTYLGGNQIYKYSEYLAGKNEMISQLDFSEYKESRIDFAIDYFDLDIYDTLYKLHRLLCLMITVQYKANNRYNCDDLLTLEHKSIDIKSKRIDISYYNKALDEPDGNVNARFELRVKCVYNLKDVKKGILPEVAAWNKAKLILTKSCTEQNYNRALEMINNSILMQFNARKDQSNNKRLINRYINKYDDVIFSVNQLTSLLDSVGYSSSQKKSGDYFRENGIEKIKFTDVKKYVSDILKAGKIYFKS